MANIKFKAGQFGNPETGETADVIVDSHNGKPGNGILMLGAALIAAGVGALCNAAFKHGAKAYEIGEIQACAKVGVLNGPEEPTNRITREYAE